MPGPTRAICELVLGARVAPDIPEVSEVSEETGYTEKGWAMAQEAEGFSVTLNELAERDLTLREIALLLNNHSRAVNTMLLEIDYLDKLVQTLMLTVAAYMRQYPLDLDKLEAGDLSPLTPPKTETNHFQHPGAYL